MTIAIDRETKININTEYVLDYEDIFCPDDETDYRLLLLEKKRRRNKRIWTSELARFRRVEKELEKNEEKEEEEIIESRRSIPLIHYYNEEWTDLQYHPAET